MNILKNKKKWAVPVVFGIAFAVASSIFSANIDAVEKYGWGAAAGWVNFNPSSGTVEVTDTEMTGNIWSDNYGWINLQPTTAGVVNDCTGNLSGHGWGDAAGWVDFTNASIDQNTGYFQGTVTGDNLGLVNLTGISANIAVKTAWSCIPPIAAPIDGSTTNDTTPEISGTSTPGYTINVVSGTSSCSAVVDTNGDWSCDLAPVLTEGDHTISVTATNPADGSTSPAATVVINIDTSVPNTPVCTTTPNPVQDGVSITTTCTGVEATATLTMPGMTCNPSPATATEEVICTGISDEATQGTTPNVTVTDLSGNAVSTVSGLEIDNIDPADVTIDSVSVNDTVVEGSGEPGATINLVGVVCDNAPVIVDVGGNWTCDITSSAPLSSGLVITATQTDPAGNVSGTVDTTVKKGGSSGPRLSGSSSETVYTCKNSKATNFSNSGTHKESLCVYEEEIVTPTLPTTPSTLGKGEQCPASQILTQNMKAGDRNGNYSSWERATIDEVKILQAHMNRLGFASGDVDGILGPITDGAIKRMQKYLGTYQDGYVGPITRSLINVSCGEEELVIVAPILDTAQCPFFTQYHQVGEKGGEILKIQVFLKSEGLLTAEPNGYYGKQTDAAVRAFQDKYFQEILAPWNLEAPTGRWYQSTRKHANLVAGCPESNVTLDNGVVIE